MLAHNGTHAFKKAFIFHTPTHTFTLSDPRALWQHLQMHRCISSLKKKKQHSETITAHARRNVQWHKSSMGEMNSFQMLKTVTYVETEPGKQVGRLGDGKVWWIDRLAHRYSIRRAGRYEEMKHYLWTHPFIFPLSSNAQRKVKPPYTHSQTQKSSVGI